MALHDTGVVLVGSSIFLAEAAHTHPRSRDWRWHKQAYASNGIVSNNTKKWSPNIIHDTWMNLKNYYPKWKKPDGENYILSDSICNEKPRKLQCTETENRSVVALAGEWERGPPGGTREILCWWKRSQTRVWWWLHDSIYSPKKSLNCTLTMVEFHGM